MLLSAKEFTEFPKLGLKNVQGGQPVYASGFAVSYYGGTRVGELIHASKYEQGGNFAEELVEAVVRLVHARLPLKSIHAVTFIPPTESGGLVEDFANRVARRIGKPVVSTIHKTRPTMAQKALGSREEKRRNLSKAFSVVGAVTGWNMIVLDDVYDTGTSLVEAGKALRKAGAGILYAVTIAKTRLSDS